MAPPVKAPSEPAPQLLRVASYNVHACVGRDGRRDEARVAAVIRELDADVIALQEVLSDDAARGPDQFSYLAEALALSAVEGPTLHDHAGRYGNAVLSRLPVLDVDRLDLSVSNRESRGAVAVDAAWGGAALRVVATHLGLRRSERRQQVGRLIAWLDAAASGRPDLLVLAGDMNEWLPLASPLRAVDRYFGGSRSPRTFPSGRPVLGLDRVWASPDAALRRVRAHRSPLARIASDHLPVVAELSLAAASAP